MAQHARGNALFLILIAVALFAALAYAVTRSDRGGGTIDREKLLLSVSEFYNVTSRMQTAINLLMLQGCEPKDVAINSRPRFVATPRPKPECDVFGQEGGRVDVNWYSTSITGAGFVNATNHWNDYYSIDLGNGYQMPITVWWVRIGSIERLSFNGWADTAGWYPPAVDQATFDQLWAICVEINKKEGYPDPYQVNLNSAAYDSAQLRTIGENITEGQEWVQMDLIVSRR